MQQCRGGGAGQRGPHAVEPELNRYSPAALIGPETLLTVTRPVRLEAASIDTRRPRASAGACGWSTGRSRWTRRAGGSSPRRAGLRQRLDVGRRQLGGGHAAVDMVEDDLYRSDAMGPPDGADTAAVVIARGAGQHDLRLHRGGHDPPRERRDLDQPQAEIAVRARDVPGSSTAAVPGGALQQRLGDDRIARAPDDVEQRAAETAGAPAEEPAAAHSDGR